MSTPSNPVTLAQWRRTVAELYADVRASAQHDVAAARFRKARDRLFLDHPDSPIPITQRPHWRGSSWFDYDPAWRIVGVFHPAATIATFEIALAADGLVRCARVGAVEFEVAGASSRLALYWIEGYGGGLWLPFGDATNGDSTYGGGRYLYDTIKGADLGAAPDYFVVDFNFAYNPSCAYDERWSCPMPPMENRLPYRITAGELLR